MGEKWNEHWSKWILFNLRIPPDMKARVETMALQLGETQSEIVRLAIDRFLQTHASSDRERSASEIAARQRRERINLMQPKDGHRTAMQVIAAWATIQKERKEFESIGSIGILDFDSWIRRLEENKIAIDPDNPERERIEQKCDFLIAKLRKERERYVKLSEVKET